MAETPIVHTLLSLDGGGIRGILQACILEELEEVLKELEKEEVVDLADYFDCIAGTSVGSILALHLADKGKHTEERYRGAGGAREAITDNAHQIFSKPWYHLPGLPSGMFAAKYGARGIDAVLKDKIFTEDCRLSHLKTSVVVPSFEVDDGGIFLFWAKHQAGQDPVTGYSTLMRKPLFYRGEDDQESESEVEEREKATQSEVEQHENQGLSGRSAAFKPTNEREGQAEVLRLQQAVVTEEVGQAPMGRRLFFAGSYLKWHYEPLMRDYPGTDFTLRTVARASSAAPTFFPAAKVQAVVSGESQSPAGKSGGSGTSGDFGIRTMVDGGMVANNPTLHAFSWMVEHLGAKPKCIAVLSLGTGSAVADVSAAARGGGAWHWKTDAVSVLMNSAGEGLEAVVDKFFYQVFNTEPGQYLRIQKTVSGYDAGLPSEFQDEDSVPVMLDALSSLDKVDRQEVLVRMGRRLGKAYRESLKEFASRYLIPRRQAREQPDGNIISQQPSSVTKQA